MGKLPLQIHHKFVVKGIKGHRHLKPGVFPHYGRHIDGFRFLAHFHKRYIPVESELFAESEALELEESAAVSRLVTFDCNVVFSSFKDSTCFSNSFICPS